MIVLPPLFRYCIAVHLHAGQQTRNGNLYKYIMLWSFKGIKVLKKFPVEFFDFVDFEL
jgi:hypothetical protein